MTLEKQIALFDALPPEEQEALGNVCIGLDRSLPPELLRSLMRRGLIVKHQGRYDVASLWIHYA